MPHGTRWPTKTLAALAAGQLKGNPTASVHHCGGTRMDSGPAEVWSRCERARVVVGLGLGSGLAQVAPLQHLAGSDESPELRLPT